MQFTASELKLVERLRKQERQWPRTRWILLLAGIFLWAIYSFILVYFFNFAHFPETSRDKFESIAWLTMFALLWPKCLIGFLVGGCMIAWAIKDWHGNANRMLLLKLLDAQQKQ